MIDDRNDERDDERLRREALGKVPPVRRHILSPEDRRHLEHLARQPVRFTLSGGKRISRLPKGIDDKRLADLGKRGLAQAVTLAPDVEWRINEIGRRALAEHGR